MLSEVISYIDSKVGQAHVVSNSAKALLLAVIPGLRELRIRGDLTISNAVISKYTQYSEFHRLAECGFLSRESKSLIQNYLHSRACYDLSIPADKQPEEVTTPWGLAHRTLVEALQSVNEGNWIE